MYLRSKVFYYKIYTNVGMKLYYCSIVIAKILILDLYKILLASALHKINRLEDLSEVIIK